MQGALGDAPAASELNLASEDDSTVHEDAPTASEDVSVPTDGDMGRDDAMTSRDAVSCIRPEMEIELDSILSRIPYQQMLQDMFGSYNKPVANVPIVSKVYEESFMRECANCSERQCAMGTRCECMFVDVQHPFVGTEFLLPTDNEKEEANLCVLCSRKITQQLYHDMLFHGLTYNGVIQRFGNICDQEGEYARQCMLICPENFGVQCMPLPIVAHQRNRYYVTIRNGLKYLRQQRVSFEDFQ